MIYDLNLKVAVAYTIHVPVDERTSKDIGVYKDVSIANKKSFGAGWYGSNGEVRHLENIFEDDKGILYQVKCLGYPTNESEERKENLLKSIKSKLSEEELDFIFSNKNE